MADIFISYARADRDKVERLAHALLNEGYTLWWDREIESGAEFSTIIERELAAANAVIVCWSKNSLTSRWVKDEATIAARDGKLKAISLDGSEPPIGYMQFHALDLSAWNGGRDGAAFKALAGALGECDKKPDVEISAAGTNGADAKDGVSLIVLPFETISVDPADGVLTNAIHEDLTTQLARVKDYFVISRTTATVCAAKNMSPAELGAEIGVAYILEGSVRRAGDDIRVTAQLIDAKTGGHVAALRFDRPASELMDLQNDLIAEIVNHLGSEINFAQVRRLEQRAGVDPTAMDYLNRARAAMARSGWNNDGIQVTTGYLEKAIEIDPDFAPAISQLALLKGLGAQFGLTEYSVEDVKTEVVALASRAVALEGQSSDVLGFAGCALCDVGESERGFSYLERAFELDPSNAQAVAAFGWAQVLQGNPQEGVRLAKAAIRISPRQPGLAFWLYGLAIGYERMGKFEDARATLERAVRSDPRFIPAYGLLAVVFLKLGDRAGAEKSIAGAKQIDPALTDAKFAKLLPPGCREATCKAGLLMVE